MEIQRKSSDHYLSRVVTFVARFQIENRTPFRIGYLQRHQLNKKVSKAEVIEMVSCNPTATKGQQSSSCDDAWSYHGVPLAES